MHFPKELTLPFISTTLLLICAGNIYVFSSYATQIRDKLGYSQLQISTVGTAGLLGLYLTGPIWGYLIDRYGPRRTGISAVTLMMIGFLCMSETYSENFKNTSFIFMSAYYLIDGIGSAGTTLSCVSLNIKSFPPHLRGMGVGFPLAGYGLSAFLLVQLKSWFFIDDETGQSDTAGFLKCIGWIMGAGVIISFVGLRESKLEWQLIEDEVDVDREKSSQVICDDELMINVDIPEQQFINSSTVCTGPVSSTTNLIHRDQSSEISIPPPSVSSVAVPQYPHSSLKTLITTLPTYYFLIIFFCLSGSGLFLITNVGAIVLSLSTQSSSDSTVQYEQGVQVALLSVANCLGRIVAGLGSDYAVSKGWKRTQALILSCAVMMAGQVVWLTVAGLGIWLNLGTLLTGFSYGSIWAICPGIVAERVIPENFGKAWGFATAIPALSQNIVNLAFGHIYDANRSPETNGECKTTSCFRPIFFLTFAMCIAGLLANFALVYSDKRLESRTRRNS
ncbi:major facilitator superfamily domain-containing protein [Paraphysoderma sedebokerense]|nr:major facilitator superfamily domain-containing protein [Paraphysoderma sedebokerense]